MAVYADDPRCVRWTAIAEGHIHCSQLFVWWEGDDLHARCEHHEKANAVALSQALPGNRFAIATYIDGVKEKRDAVMRKHDPSGTRRGG